MDKNNLKKNRAEKAKAEEAILNRILCWVVGGAVLEFLILLLNRYWVYYTTDEIELRLALDVAVKIIGVAGLVCAVVSAFWWNSARKSGKKSVLPAVLFPVFLGISVSCVVAWFFPMTGLRFMYIAVPVVIVLVLIYYLYQHEFFLTACESALALLGIWIASKGTGGSHGALVYGYTVVAALLILCAAYFCRKAQEDGGKIPFRGEKLRLFSKDANYAMLYAGAAILVLVLILAAVGVSPVILYSVTVAWVLIMAVYYTVKLM